MKYRLGSRGSDLALSQVKIFEEAFTRAYPEDELEIVVIKTQGDKKQGTPGAHLGDKRDWIAELEEQISSQQIDIALHCGKDIPAKIDTKTQLIPVLDRPDARDIFVGKTGSDGKRLSFHDLPQQATVGTASVRRKAQLLRVRPDLHIVDLRGNIPTRLRKLEERSDLHGMVIAAVGLIRLENQEEIGELLSVESHLPAVNQGILACQVANGREELKQQLIDLSGSELAACFEAERKVAEVLDGDCNSAIGIYAYIKNDELILQAEVYSHDGKDCISEQLSGNKSSAIQLGISVGESLLVKGAKDLI